MPRPAKTEGEEGGGGEVRKRGEEGEGVIPSSAFEVDAFQLVHRGS